MRSFRHPLFSLVLLFALSPAATASAGPLRGLRNGWTRMASRIERAKIGLKARLGLYKEGELVLAKPRQTQKADGTKTVVEADFKIENRRAYAEETRSIEIRPGERPSTTVYYPGNFGRALRETFSDKAPVPPLTAAEEAMTGRDAVAVRVGRVKQSLFLYGSHSNSPDHLRNLFDGVGHYVEAVEALADHVRQHPEALRDRAFLDDGAVLLEVSRRNWDVDGMKGYLDQGHARGDQGLPDASLLSRVKQAHATIQGIQALEDHHWTVRDEKKAESDARLRQPLAGRRP